jgi:hypothetical protein
MPTLFLGKRRDQTGKRHLKAGFWFKGKLIPGAWFYGRPERVPHQGSGWLFIHQSRPATTSTSKAPNSTVKNSICFW